MQICVYANRVGSGTWKAASVYIYVKRISFVHKFNIYIQIGVVDFMKASCSREYVFMSFCCCIIKHLLVLDAVNSMSPIVPSSVIMSVFKRHIYHDGRARNDRKVIDRQNM